MTRIIGITGGIGSGKSTFSKQVKKRGLRLLDSDEQVSFIYKKPNKKFLVFLKKIGLGKAISGDKINKKIISNTIFNNKVKKLKLEKYIFKIVRKNRSEFIKKEKKRKTKIVFLDIPLLFENKLSKQFDTVISIISSRKERYNRLKKSKKISKNLFDKIIKSQTSDVERDKKSDIVIKNNTSMKIYLNRVNRVLDKIIK